MKIKKLISVFLSVIIGTTLMAANISAADTADERAASTMAYVDDIVENEALTNSSDIVYLGNVNWVDSMTVRWREGNTTYDILIGGIAL